MAGIPASVAGTLIITFGRSRRVPESIACVDRRLGVVGEVGGAFEGDEPVAAVALVVGGAQQVGGAADVLEREREEQLLRVVRSAGDGVAQLVVVALGSR